jgi:hypothetical protein
LFAVFVVAVAAAPVVVLIKSRKNKMGEACVVYGGEEKFMQNIDGESTRKNLRRPRHI